MSTALHGLLRRVVDAWPMDDRGPYPNFPPVGTEARDSAVLAHIGLHIGKTAGKLVGLVEPLAHGAIPQGIDHNEAARQVAYAIVNALRFAAALDIEAGDILEHIDEWEAEQTTRVTRTG